MPLLQGCRRRWQSPGQTPAREAGCGETAAHDPAPTRTGLRPSVSLTAGLGSLHGEGRGTEGPSPRGTFTGRSSEQTANPVIFTCQKEAHLPRRCPLWWQDRAGKRQATSRFPLFPFIYLFINFLSFWGVCVCVCVQYVFPLKSVCFNVAESLPRLTCYFRQAYFLSHSDLCQVPGPTCLLHPEPGGVSAAFPGHTFLPGETRSLQATKAHPGASRRQFATRNGRCSPRPPVIYSRFYYFFAFCFKPGSIPSRMAQRPCLD